MNQAYTGILLLAVVLGFSATDAQAAYVAFFTDGGFSTSGTAVVTFMDSTGTTTLAFNGDHPTVVTTPAGVSFGNFVVTSTEPPGVLGPPISGNFTLDIIQLSGGGEGTFSDHLSGTLGFDMGVGTITFATTSMSIRDFTYTIDPVYTIALPVTGGGGGAGVGTTTIQGTITGGTAVPDNGTTLVLLGGALLGLVVVQRRLQSAQLSKTTFLMAH
jgi:hypothetical protein